MGNSKEKEVNVNENGEKQKTFRQEQAEAKTKIKEVKAKNGMGKFGKTILAIAFLGVVVIGVMLVWSKVNPNTEPATKIDVTIIEEQLKEIQEISTAKYTYTDVQIFKNTRKVPVVNIDIPLTTKSFKIKYSGEIKAFFDMKKCELDVNSNKVTIELPEVKMSQSLDDDVIEEHNSIFNPIKIDDQSGFVDDLKVIMEARAIEKGIMDEAKKNAEKMITSLLTPMLSEGQTIDVHQSKAGLLADEKRIVNIAKKAAKIKKGLHTVDQPED